MSMGDNNQWITTDVYESKILSCGKQNNGPHRCPRSNSQNLWILSYMSKGTLQMWLKLRTLRWGEEPELSRWAQSNPISPLKYRGFFQLQRIREMAAGEELAGFEHRDGKPWANEHRQILEAGRDKEMGSPLNPPERKQPYIHLDFSPARPLWEFWPTELKKNKCVLFEATKFVVICYSSNRNLIPIRSGLNINILRISI